MKVSSGRTEASMSEPGSGSETIGGLDKVMYYTHTCVSAIMCAVQVYQLILSRYILLMFSYWSALLCMCI